MIEGVGVEGQTNRGAGKRGEEEEGMVAIAVGLTENIGKMGSIADDQLKEGEVGEEGTMNQAGVAVEGTDIAVGRQRVEGAGMSWQLNHNRSAGNSNLWAFGCNFGEGKEGGQCPNSERTDSHEIGVEPGAVEEGFEQVVAEEEMMIVVGQEGMADKKPCPNS